MIFRIAAFLALMPLAAMSGDSPLPFSNLSAASVDQAAFANPAAAAIGTGGEMGLGWAEWDAPGGKIERMWATQYQGNGHGEGLRFYQGNGPYQARFDLALAGYSFGDFSPGIRFGYLSFGRGTDHGVVDAGLDFRPWPQFLLGYWGDNLWSGESDLRIHHLAAAVKPFGAREGWPADFQLGLGWTRPETGSRQAFVFTQVPLFLGMRLQTQWDFQHREGALGLVLQATGQVAGAMGWSRGNMGQPGIGSTAFPDARKPRGREAAIAFRKDQRTPFLAEAGNTAELDLNHNIVEGEAFSGWLGGGDNLGFVELQDRFDVLEANPHVKSVLIKLGKAHCGWAMGEEIRGRILSLRSHGKHVVAYMEQVSPLNYFLASAADVVALQPEGYFAVTGFAAEVTFYRGFFDKIGVEPQFLRHGKFKSYEEPYMLTAFSEPARANLSGYLGSLWDHYLEVVSQSRKLSKDSLRKALESGEISLEHARKSGLVDTLVQQDQVLKLAGGPHAILIPIKAEAPYRGNWDLPPQIAVVVITGDMVLGSSAHGWVAGPDLAGSETVVDQLRRARLNPRVRAVVLRVDSPGGSAQAADIMWREVELLKEAGKPVVASVGHDAASGGYYMICGADRILAEPNSTVGSIGVLWGKFVLKGLYEKLGLNVETVKTSPHADGNTMSRTWDSTEVDILQRHMDQFYRDFVAKVAAGRHKSKDAVDSMGQGQIFTGTQALRNGLIDSIGGYAASVAEAARLAGLKKGTRYEVALITSDKEGNGFTTLGRNLALAPTGLASLEGEIARYRDLAQPGLWAISPEMAGWMGLPGPTRE